MATQDHESLTPADRARVVKDKAAALGFHSCGITDLSPPPHSTELSQWLVNGFAGTMSYMNRQKQKRLEPTRILDGANRAVVVTRRYDNPDPPPRPGNGKVARYARGADYHAALRKPLEDLTDTILGLGDATTVARAFVDAGPVPERELAQRAGLGWIGKNTMLIDPSAGSFLFIAEVLTDLDIKTDEPFEADRCGTCRLCLDACPTEAFPSPRELDARACISYLTIEYRGDFPAEKSLNGWVFGCDECQTVCPWNVSFSKPAEDPLLAREERLAQLDLGELDEMDEAEFRDRYGHTPLERPGLAGMRRNARRVREELSS